MNWQPSPIATYIYCKRPKRTQNYTFPLSLPTLLPSAIARGICMKRGLNSSKEKRKKKVFQQSAWTGQCMGRVLCWHEPCQVAPTSPVAPQGLEDPLSPFHRQQHSGTRACSSPFILWILLLPPPNMSLCNRPSFHSCQTLTTFFF